MEEKISVVINTYNSEKYLERVLSSVKDFDEILICDMHSTDRTLEIANKYSCNIVYHERCTIVEPARNFAIQSASNEWVLLIDSDEVVPAALKNYLYNTIKEKNDLQGLWLARKNYALGHFLHGDYPDYILRFFRKSNIHWSPHVHSRPQVKGSVKRIPKRKKELALIHLANNSISDKLRKTDIYTDNEISKRANQKFPILKMFTATFFRFFRSYIIKGGFRDGKAGVVTAGMDAFYKFTTIAKIWESKVGNEDLDKDLS